MWINRFVCTGMSVALLAACGVPEGGAVDESDAVGSTAQGLFQSSVTVVSQTGVTYYTTAGKHCIYIIPTIGGTASNFTGACNSAGLVDGLPGTSRFNAPYGLVVDDAGGNLYVTDTGNSAIRRVNMTSGRVTTVVTKSQAISAGAAAGFTISNFGPRGVAMFNGGRIFITDAVNQVTWLYGSGVLTYQSGSPGIAGDVDGTGRAARFSTPDLASSYTCTTSFFGDICVLTVEPLTGKHRSIDPSGKVTTL